MPANGIRNANSERARIARSRGELPVISGDRTVPPVPLHLRKTGRAIWDLAWKAPWTLDSDVAAVDDLCVLEDDVADFTAQVSADGLVHEKTLTSARGDIVGTELQAHPLLIEIRRCRALANQLRKELGLTPVSRARLGLSVVEGETKKSEYERLAEMRNAKRGAA
jgi:P27 family predicted phage terminase small subunit